MAVTMIKFEPYDENEDIEQYFERLELFMTANGVSDAGKESEPRAKWNRCKNLCSVERFVGAK